MADDLKDQLTLSVEWERLKRKASKARVAAYATLIEADNAEKALVVFEQKHGLKSK